MKNPASSHFLVSRLMIGLVLVLSTMRFALCLPTITTVFYDMPPELMPQVVPVPSGDLLDVPAIPGLRILTPAEATLLPEFTAGE
jgi:hypothetical protein